MESDRVLVLAVVLVASLVVLAIYSGRDVASEVAMEILRLLAVLVLSYYVSSKVVARRLTRK
ncbi:MAG: hypothetical protein QXY39_01765 [Thermofilaceae archaeon]